MTEASRKWLPMPSGHKGRYPFVLSVPSYVYPADILPNVERLMPHVDAIELVLFEGTTPWAFPEKKVVDGLRKFRMEGGLQFNVHLPIDITLTQGRQQECLDIYCRMMAHMGPVEPVTWTLHLPFDPERHGRDTELFQDEAVSGLRALEAASGIPLSRISVETLEYPALWLEPIVKETGALLCLDLGHLIVSGQDTASLWERLSPHASIVHWHGVAGGKDHQPLSVYPDQRMSCFIEWFSRFDGIVSIEVFQAQGLAASLDALERAWTDGKDTPLT